MASRQGPLSGQVLQGVYLDDNRVSVDRGAHQSVFNEEESGKVATFNCCDCQVDHTGKGVDHTAGRKEYLGRLGEVDREVGNRIALDERCILVVIHGSPSQSERHQTSGQC